MNIFLPSHAAASACQHPACFVYNNPYLVTFSALPLTLTW